MRRDGAVALAFGIVAAVAGGLAVLVAIEQSRQHRQLALEDGPALPVRITKQPSSTRGSTMDFYNMKTKSTVSVPEDQIRKRRMVRTTSGGKRQERYAAVAEVDVDGKPVRMFKFLNKEQFDSLTAPEED
jgi:hypothetical protein